MENKFKIGDIVSLKSGGQKMTIKEIVIEHPKNNLSRQEFCGNYICVWFDETDSLKKDKFSEETLTDEL